MNVQLITEDVQQMHCAQIIQEVLVVLAKQDILEMVLIVLVMILFSSLKWNDVNLHLINKNN